MRKRKYRPESLMMSHGYKPELSQGAIKCPIFATSTFAFRNAEEGKAFFEMAYGLRGPEPGEELGLIYSRINNPDLEILENRLCLWDGAEEAAVFESGMSAITTVMLEFLRPGDLILHSMPVYGGTDHFIETYLPEMGIHSVAFDHTMGWEEIIARVEDTGRGNRLAMIFIETPANPTNDLIDIKLCKEVARYFSRRNRQVLLVVDNTYLGPLWQHPIRHGADLVVYSASKYIGGHSDVIAGAVLGNTELLKRVKTLRTFLGNMAGPWTGWLLLRSLETLKIRMQKQTKNAQLVAGYLANHPMIERVYYLGLIPPGTPEHAIYRRQCEAPGAMLAFDIRGGEKEAFQFLNNLKLIKLAVSLGSTESLAEHPQTMTHAACEPSHREALGVTEQMIRLSIGVEHPEDLMADIGGALEAVGNVEWEAINH